MIDKRIRQFDILRTVSILGVVLIHATAPYLVNLLNTGTQKVPAFYVLVVLNQAARFCVPAFFIFAGFFTTFGSTDYFSNPSELKKYFKKRVVRLLLPYIFWSIFLFILPRILSRGSNIGSLLLAIILGSTIEGGYFIIALTQLTIIGPLLVRFIKDRNWIYRLVIFLCFLITELVFITAGYADWRISRWLRVGFSYFLSTFLPWSFYYVSGLALGINYAKWYERKNFSLTPALILVVIFFVISIFEFFIILDVSQSLNLAASFLKPSSIVYAYLICYIFLCSWPQGLFKQKFWRLISDSSFGIYLIHGSVLSFLLSLDFHKIHWLLGVSISVISSVGFSFLVYSIIDQKFPKWVSLITFGKKHPTIG